MNPLVFQVEELIGFLLRQEFFIDEGFDEKVSKNLTECGKAFVLIQGVEAILRIDQAIGGEDVHVGMESQVITKGVDDGNGGDLSMR